MKDILSALGPQLSAAVGSVITAAGLWCVRFFEKRGIEKRVRKDERDKLTGK